MPQFDLTNSGVNPIIIQIDNTDAKALYQKTYKWVQESYKDPKEVLKTNLENEKIRVEGFQANAWHYKSLGVRQEFDMEYSLEIEFKDNRIRLTFSPGQFWTQGQNARFTYTGFYKNNGELKPIYKEAETSLEESMNAISKSLFEYLTVRKKDDW